MFLFSRKLLNKNNLCKNWIQVLPDRNVKTPWSIHLPLALMKILTLCANICSHYQASTWVSEGTLRPWFLSGSCHGAFLVREEALKHHDLTDADDKQQDGFSDGPVGDALQQVLCFCAILCLSQPVPCLWVSHHLQDLMNGDARWLQLITERLMEIHQYVQWKVDCTDQSHINLRYIWHWRSQYLN